MNPEKPYQGDPYAPEAPQHQGVFKRGLAGTHFGSRINLGGSLGCISKLKCHGDLTLDPDMLYVSSSGWDLFIYTREEPQWNGQRFLSTIPTAIAPGRHCQGNPIKALLRAVGSLAKLRCGCNVASLRAGSVTLTDEILNILQGLRAV